MIYGPRVSRNLEPCSTRTWLPGPALTKPWPGRARPCSNAARAVWSCGKRTRTFAAHGPPRDGKPGRLPLTFTIISQPGTETGPALSPHGKGIMAYSGSADLMQGKPVSEPGARHLERGPARGTSIRPCICSAPRYSPDDAVRSLLPAQPGPGLAATRPGGLGGRPPCLPETSPAAKSAACVTVSTTCAILGPWSMSCAGDMTRWGHDPKRYASGSCPLTRDHVP